MWCGRLTQMESNLSRRAFIARMGLGTITSYFAAGMATTEVAVTAQNLTGTGTLRLRIADFPALQQDFGSLRIGTSPQAGTYPSGLFDPIIINRAPGPVYHAMSARCPHEGCTVGKYAPANERMLCPCHGSQFRIDGSYVTGPANSPLQTFESTVQNGVLLVEVPDLPFRLNFTRLSPQRDRLALEFIAFENIRYETHYRASMNVPPTAVPFALTPTAPFSQTEFLGQSDWVTFYVPLRESAGIYTVSMKTMQV